MGRKYGMRTLAVTFLDEQRRQVSCCAQLEYRLACCSAATTIASFSFTTA